MNGTIENRFVLDTNAIIFLTTRGNIIPSNLEYALNEAALFTSVISEIEVFSKPALPSDEEENLRSFLSERIIIIDLSNEIKKETIALRRSTKLKLPDSIVAATSIVLDAILLTDDEHLLSLSLPGLKAQHIF
jgi:predicted nucleic acid-binding protein